MPSPLVSVSSATAPRRLARASQELKRVRSSRVCGTWTVTMSPATAWRWVCKVCLPVNGGRAHPTRARTGTHPVVLGGPLPVLLRLAGQLMSRRKASNAWAGTTPLPRALSWCLRVSPGIPVTQPARRPISHSHHWGVSRRPPRGPRSVGGGEARPVSSSQRLTAGRYSPHHAEGER